MQERWLVDDVSDRKPCRPNAWRLALIEFRSRHTCGTPATVTTFVLCSRIAPLHCPSMLPSSVESSCSSGLIVRGGHPLLPSTRSILNSRQSRDKAGLSSCEAKEGVISSGPVYSVLIDGQHQHGLPKHLSIDERESYRSEHTARSRNAPMTGLRFCAGERRL